MFGLEDELRERIEELEKENKRLKEDVEKWTNLYNDARAHIEDLNEQLDAYGD